MPVSSRPWLWDAKLQVVQSSRARSLVAPYCAIPRDYLSDTPLLRAMGFLVSQHGQLGAIPPPPFLSISPLESMRSGSAIPSHKRGISAILAQYPMKQGKWVRYPPLRYYLEKVLRYSQERKFSPKRKFSARHPCGHPAKNFGQALQILENKHFGTDIPRGRPWKNFGLKNFGLIFRSQYRGGISHWVAKARSRSTAKS